ncbi:hypothetical protein TIFTF001_011172 [Ficus carica]|uniref:Glycosyltransferase n=1 Tax=Ficus carica TaxID=3494 RepID=A0AA87ZWQ5_FICCA|nr:hypothetical protein TIFTF001_011172 [Ficus carica]
MSFSSDSSQVPHVALFPSAGMGHLTPLLRFAALLLRRHHCRLTLITANPTVSLAESRLISRFLSSFPAVSHVQFDLLPLDSSTVATDDPFWLQFEATRRSLADLVAPLLSSLSPPLSALVLDISLITPVGSIADSLSLPCYVLYISTARMLSLFTYFPKILASGFSDASLKIPGLVSPIARSSLPSMMFNPTSLFANIFLTDAPKLRRLHGVLINTFDGFEADSELEALVTEGKVADGGPYFPPLFSVGPFPPCKFEFEPDPESNPSAASAVSKWLDEQPEGSVVYVSFGSRTALPREQMREVGKGLILSGHKFLWVVKDKKVDKEEEEGNIDEVVGKELMEKLKEKGLVVKKWVDQGEILGHKAVGGFVSHCGPNSLVESAWHGVKILAWPQHGDQRVAAEVVRECGLGMWVESWGWLGGDHDPTAAVKGEEIGERIREMMGSEKLSLKAASIREKARKADEVGGSRDKVFERLVHEWKNKKSVN